MNLYEILQVSPYASALEINVAYQTLANHYYQAYKVATNAPTLYNDAMERINYAYSILSDNKKRSEYNQASGYQSNYYDSSSHTPYQKHYSKGNLSKNRNLILAISITFVVSIIFSFISGNSSNSILNSIIDFPAKIESFSQPEVALPASGIIGVFVTEEAIAPLEIISNANAGNYYIKLLDANNDSLVATIFIRENETVNINLPLGSYKIKFAVGNKWYGESYLFGSETKYYNTDNTFNFSMNGNQVNGFTINLNEAIAGNLPTEQVNKKNW